MKRFTFKALLYFPFYPLKNSIEFLVQALFLKSLKTPILRSIEVNIVRL